MADLLPIFPLGSVLYPGIPLPLHIFEQRYLTLFSDLLTAPEPRRFGVVAIRHGAEVGDDDVETFEVGCVAQVRRVIPRRDGRMDVVATGGPRFRLRCLEREHPYRLAQVDYLPEAPGPDAADLAGAVSGAFEKYWAAVATARGVEDDAPDLPADPGLLAWVVAASVQLDVPEKQSLLEIEDTASRLRAELALLRRETVLVRQALARPAPERGDGYFSLN